MFLLSFLLDILLYLQQSEKLLLSKTLLLPKNLFWFPLIKRNLIQLHCLTFRPSFWPKQASIGILIQLSFAMNSLLEVKFYAYTIFYYIWFIIFFIYIVHIGIILYFLAKVQFRTLTDLIDRKVDTRINLGIWNCVGHMHMVVITITKLTRHRYLGHRNITPLA